VEHTFSRDDRPSYWCFHKRRFHHGNAHNPPHPGRIVRQECLEAIRLSVTEAARVLGVTRQILNNLVNEKVGVSPEMAVCLEKVFGGAADTWLRMQSAYSTPAPRQCR